MSEATQGAESVVGVTMAAREDETGITLRHSGLPGDELRQQHTQGWTWILSALEQGLASRRSASSSD